MKEKVSALLDGALEEQASSRMLESLIRVILPMSLFRFLPPRNFPELELFMQQESQPAFIIRKKSSTK